MRLIVLLSVMMATTVASAFMIPTTSTPLQSRNMMSSTSADSAPLVITGNNIELTEALSAYVQKRIGGPLGKLNNGGIIRECDVHLSVTKNPKVKDAHRVDLTANLKGLTIHCKESSPDMYASIDAAAAALNRKLKKYKERRVQGYHGGQGISDDFMSAMDALDEYNSVMESDAPAAAVEAKDDDETMVDPGAPTVTKIKSYDLENAISLEEAIFSLDYVDHDFFVFKNAETNKVNVVYKRTAGGVGLIEV